MHAIVSTWHKASIIYLNFIFVFLQEELSVALKEVLGSIRLVERGVFVQASTLGSMEALLEFLRTSKIPVSHLDLGLTFIEYINKILTDLGYNKFHTWEEMCPIYFKAPACTCYHVSWRMFCFVKYIEGLLEISELCRTT